VVEPGRTCLGDRYELGGLVAAGGMGQVWRGTDVLLGRPVAVKVLRSEYTGDPTFLARFRAEAQNAAALSHPHIACVFDYGETVAQDGSGETLAYLVMELIEGRPLNEIIHSSGGLDPEMTLRILEQTASGLAEAHRAGMVHRDVKPGNILVTPAGDVKITDFGIAWSARSVALTQTGQVLGTPQYLSPEQAEGRQATPASDVYALGLIGYECLAGQAAFDGENAVTIALKQVREEPRPLPEAVPAPVRTLVGRALAKDPAQRFPDGAAFLAAVEAVREGRSIDPAPSTVVAPAVASAATSAVPAGPTARGAARMRRHRAPAGSPPARPPARRRRSRVAVVLLPLLGLLAGAGIAAMVLQGLAGNGNPPAEAAAERQDDTGVVLEEKDYLGRPADEVAVQLAAFGLTVKRETRQSADAEPGTVIGVQPAGERLEPGATVVIVVATAPGEATGTATSGREGTSAVPSVTAAASSAPAEEAAPEEDTSAESDAATGSATSEEPADGSSTPPSGTGTGGATDPATEPATEPGTDPATESGTEPGSTPSEPEDQEEPEQPTEPVTAEPTPAGSSATAESSEGSDGSGSGSGSSGDSSGSGSSGSGSSGSDG
jgi:eukaryotic-like serine/threonine-protein kinase